MGEQRSVAAGEADDETLYRVYLEAFIASRSASSRGIGVLNGTAMLFATARGLADGAKGDVPARFDAFCEIMRNSLPKKEAPHG